MKKIISLFLCIVLTFSYVVSVGAYSFTHNGTATNKATAYRLPSVNSGDVWWVDKNDKLQVFCQDGDYYLVLYPFNNTGKHVIAYVPTSAVSTSGVPSSSNFYKNEIVRTNSSANLYHNPSTDTLTGASGSNQTVRTTVAQGQELTVLFEKDGFYCVRTLNDTGFIEKSKICTHTNTSKQKTASDTAINYNDASYHQVQCTYKEVCNVCGMVTNENITETTREKHTFSDNKCSTCGYEMVAPECTHTNTQDDVKSYIVVQKNDTHHTVTDTYDIYCTDCNEVIKKDAKRTFDEIHTLKDDACEKCSYTVPGSEASICKHKNTAKHSSDDMKTTISIKDDNQHTIASYYHVWCTDCFTYIKENELDLVHENHTFVNNICSVCNLEKFVEKTAYVYNTDGDNLNMRSQANSNSSIVAKIPAGATLTVTGDAVNGFYPIKYSGKTGYASTAYITFIKPSISKTAYVYNTDGANLNMRSQANKNASIVTKMPEGSTLTVTGDAINGFYPIKYGNYTGYASTAYITFTKPTSSTVTGSNTTAKYQNIVNTIGWQTKRAYGNWAYMCGCYCTAYAHSYISGKTHLPSEYWKNASDATTHWSRANGKSSYKNNNAQVLSAAKSSIDAGKPCVLKVASSFAGQHYLLVISYTGNGTAQSNFTVIDPYDGKFKSLSNYTIHASSKQVITF